MGMEGIGARVARKEDKRFITGAGRYVDDMVVPGMKHAMFVRSPHAHAEIKKIDTKAAKAMPGVIGVLTGKELKADGIGNLICGWMIHVQGRHADEDGRLVAAGGRSRSATSAMPSSVVVADTKAQARDAAEAVNVTYKELKGVADAADALKKGAPQLHTEAANNLIFDWGIGDEKAATRCNRRRSTRYAHDDPQQPAGAERHGAARSPWRLRQGGGPLHLLDDVAKSACRASGDERLLQCRAGKQAARHCAGCRRRFRLQDLYLSGRDRLPLGLQEDRRAGQVGG
jgi:CO/xanthine dehydrogenase Mo-binding subunit